MPISLKANSDGSAEILNGVNKVLDISQDGWLGGKNIQGYNYIINGNFDIWQRGTSQTTNTAYGSDDRWINSNTGATKTHTRQPFGIGETFPNGEMCPKFYSRTVVSSVAGAANNALKVQRIESVHTLAGKKATLTFYAKSDAPKNLAFEAAQVFGTGGSPSATVLAISSQKVSLTTVWQRFVITFDVPSIVGKTLGSDMNDYFSPQFWFDAGSDFNARTGSLGHQSGTFDIACVSLVEGDVDVKPIPRSYGEELALCQRYYESGRAEISGFGTSGVSSSTTVLFAVTKRVTPTLTYTTTGNVNVSVFDVRNPYIGGLAVACVPTSGPTGYIFSCNWTATAEL